MVVLIPRRSDSCFGQAEFYSCSRRKAGGNLCAVFNAEHVFFMADLFTSSGNFVRR